jgi:type III secretion protein T
VDQSLFIQLFGRLHDYIAAAGFAVARLTGMMMVLPAFTRLGATGILRAAIALVLAFPIVPVLVQSVGGQDLTVTTTAVLLLKEVIVGLIIGLVLGVPFWAAEAAGGVLDLQRGSTSASLMDPSAMTAESISGTLFGLVMVALYFGSGGLPLTLRFVYDSYGLWPAAHFLPLFSATAGGLLIGLLDNVVTMGLMLGAPLVVCLLLTDLLLALVSRAAPHLNVFALSLGVKNLVFALLLVLYCGFLVRYMSADFESFLTAGHQLKAIAPPAAQQ